MLQAYFVAVSTLSGVSTTKQFMSVEPALSWIADRLTNVAGSTATISLVTRYQDNATTTYCDHTLIAATAVTLAALRTCP